MFLGNDLRKKFQILEDFFETCVYGNCIEVAGGDAFINQIKVFLEQGVAGVIGVFAVGFSTKDGGSFCRKN